jgi:N-acetyl-alpha-D-glucosaminyl L-malate synthase BshA
MRIGQVAHASVGGSTRVAVDLGRILAARGHAVHFFAAKPVAGVSERTIGTHWLDAGANGGLSSKLDTDWPERRIDAFVELLAEAALQARLEVLHFHYGLPFAEVAAGVRRALGDDCPMLVLTLHGTDVSVLDRVRERMLYDGLAAVDVLTTVSASHAALIERRLDASPAVIPNFVDLERFRPGRGRWRRRRPRIAYVSNFRPVKNSAAAARVFASVCRQLDAELWLIGDGELLPAVRDALREHAVLDRVRFCGLRIDVHRFLPRTDLMLVTSHTESFGLAALEALACGVPVVAPDVGGLPEVVDDGTTGLLFEPGDEGSAVEAVRRILCDGQLLGAMRSAARRHAHSFASDAVVGRYEQLYQSASRRAAHPQLVAAGRACAR